MFWLTLILVAITGYYAYITARMAKTSEASVRLMKQQSDAMTRPYLTISLFKQSENPFIFLRIENTGQTPAENLTLSLGQDFEKIKDIEGMKPLCKSHLFTQTTETFLPHSPVLFLIGIGSTLYGGDKEKYPQETFTIIAEYSFADRNVSEKTVIDVNQYNQSVLESDEIVKALKNIKDEISKK